MKLFISVTLLLFSIFAYAQKNKNQYWDSIDLRKRNLEKQFLNLQPHDAIADIGTGTGYDLIPLLASCHRCKVSGEDINSKTFNPKVLAKLITENGSVIDPQNISYTYGTEQSTMLPSDTFSKVLLFDVLHEMTYKKEMLADIKRIMKPGGTLFIEEILAHKPVKKNKKCNYRFMTEPEFLDVMRENNYLINRELIVFDIGKNTYIKMFACVPKE